MRFMVLKSSLPLCKLGLAIEHSESACWASLMVLVCSVPLWGC
uniref:Uncharacterized protein n=1 Tax=Rhizophora mucronata TaxID=61149 RepID=A0A2P2PWG8_RHIMU